MASANQTPLAAYSFDEGEGSTVEDLTGDGHTATIEGADWSTRGKYGGAMEFDREAHDFLKVPAAEDLDETEELTVEAWVRPSETSYLAEIVMKEREGSGAKYSWTLDQQGAEAKEAAGYFMQTEEGMLDGGEGSLPLNTWTHLAITDDGAHNRLYVNGELVDTAPAIAFDGHGDIRIGGNAAFGQWFDGRIDEVRIYDRALSQAEVQSDSASPIHTPQQSPVAAYSFDEGEGETVEDLTGDGHDGTIEGAEWAKGRYGDSLKFDGEDMVTIPASEDLNLTEEFTLEAWIKPEAEGEYGHLFAKEDAAEEQAAYVISKHESRLLGRLGIPGVEEESPSETLELGSWQHVAATYDGSRVRLYVNGELVGNAPVADILSTDGALRIGGADLWWSDEGFKGRIDEVRIYDRALGAGEIGGDSAAPIQTPQKNPVAAYSFDAGEGSTLEDISGNEHDGTIEGPEWTDRGRFGNALQFNGEEGECVTVPDAEDLRTTEELTLEAWVKPTAPANDDPILYKSSWGYTGDALGIGIWSEGKPEGLIGEGEGEFESVVGPKAIEANVWTHLAFTYDGAHMRLYVNGELVATQAQGEGPPWGEGDLVIGCNPNYSPEVFDGKIDEVRIYDRALTADEVRPDVTPPTQPRGIVARFESEEEENTYVTWVNSSDPSFSSGYPGSGVTSYVYRYKLGEESWSPWLSTPNPAFGLEGTTEGESIWVAVVAKDAAGNASPIAHARLHSVVSNLTPENIGEASPGLEVGNPTPLPEPSTYPGEDSEEEELSDLALKDTSSETLCPETTRCGKYNWKVAGWYARRWVLAGEHNEEVEKHHNHEFFYFGEQGGDCTNFASQVLWAGNMQFLKTEGEDSPDEDLNYPTSQNPAYHSGPGSWWSAYYYNPSEVINGHGRKHFAFRQSWVRAPVLYRHLIETGLARVYTSDPIREGDMLFFDLYHGDDTAKIDHTEVVSAVLPGEEGRNGTILLSQHSDAKTVSLHEEFQHVREKYGERGKDWEAWYVRPMYTKVNLDELELE